MNLAGWIPGRSRHHIVDGESQDQELAHQVQHVLHAAIHAPDVQVRGDRVREKAFLDCRRGDPPGEAPASVADVEDDAALASLPQRRIDMA